MKALPDNRSSVSRSPLDGRLRRLALCLVADEATADDVVQEAWVASLSRSDQELDDPEAWMRKVTWRIAKRALRDAGTRHRFESRVERSSFEDASDQPLVRAEAIALLRERVDALPQLQAVVLRLRYFEGLKMREVAQCLDLPLGTVKSASYYGLQTLRTWLDQRYGERRSWSLALIAAFPWTAREVKEALAPASTGVVVLASLGASLLVGGMLFLALGAEQSAVPTRAPSAALVEPAPRSELARGEAAESRRLPLEARRSDARVAPVGEARSADAVRLEVRTVDAAGLPIAGARLFVLATPLEPRERGRTDSEGKFSWVLQPEDLTPADMAGQATDGERADDDPASVSFFAHAPGWARSDMRRVEVPAGELTTVVFRFEQTGVDLASEVRDPSGRALARARATLTHRTLLADEVRLLGGATLAQHEVAPGAPGDQGTPGWFLVVESGEDGSLRFRDCAPGEYVLRVTAEGYSMVEETLDLRAPGPVTLARPFVLLPSGRVGGRVLDQDGRGVAGAEVWNAPIAAEETKVVRTDEHGTFVLDGLALGPAHLRARGPERERVAQTELLVEQGVTAHWSPVLARTAFLSVRLVDAERAPLAGWRVLFRRDVTHRPLAEECTTDADGRAVAHFLVEPPVTAYVFAPRSALVGRKPVHILSGLVPGEAEREIVLGSENHRAALCGRILDPQRTLPASSSLALLPLDHAHRSDMAIGASGRFRLAGVVPGRYVLCLTAALGGCAILSEVELVAGVEHDLGELRAPGRGRLLVENLWPASEFEHGMGFVLAFMGPGDLPLPVDMRVGTPRNEYELFPGRYAIGVYDGSPGEQRPVMALLRRTFVLGRDEECLVTLAPEGPLHLPLYVEGGGDALERLHMRLFERGSSDPSPAVDARVLELMEDGSALYTHMEVEAGSWRAELETDDGRRASLDFEAGALVFPAALRVRFDGAR